MTRTILSRLIVGIVAVTLALGAIAGPASARTFNFNSNGSLVQQPTSPGTTTASGGSGVAWGYIAIGSSAAALVLIGVGAAATGRRRSRADRSQRATIAR